MLIRLQSGFHFRRGIPVRFRAALGKREIWHSLETLDRDLARTRACAMYGLTSQLFEFISLAMSPSEETSSLNKAVGDLSGGSWPHLTCILSSRTCSSPLSRPTTVRFRL
ncbi:MULTISPECIES: DUF6538 domain-containing protein [unclassified Gluconobacter]|uniref:DUF6538 domain-containing protein n=1 Tax=unclassified Gluconobacter TaxID=2644261 RepID=UPI0035304FAD